MFTLSQLSTRVGRDEKHVVYHVKLLDSSGLVEKAGGEEDGPTLYVARLKRQPAWITRAVNQYRLAD